MGRECLLWRGGGYDSVVKDGLLVEYEGRGGVGGWVDVMVSGDVRGSNIGCRLSMGKESVFRDVNGKWWVCGREVSWYGNVSSCKIGVIEDEKYNECGLWGLVIGWEGRGEMRIGKLGDGK